MTDNLSMSSYPTQNTWRATWIRYWWIDSFCCWVILHRLFWGENVKRLTHIHRYTNWLYKSTCCHSSSSRSPMIFVQSIWTGSTQMDPMRPSYEKPSSTSSSHPNLSITWTSLNVPITPYLNLVLCRFNLFYWFKTRLFIIMYWFEWRIMNLMI